jgi:hypothetical protein
LDWVRWHIAAITGTCDHHRMGENMLLSNDLRKLRRLRTLCAAVTCISAVGFVFDLWIVIARYHPTNRLHQIVWLPTYALMAFAWFLWFRVYSARIAAVTQSMNRTEPKPQ